MEVDPVDETLSLGTSDHKESSSSSKGSHKLLKALEFFLAVSLLSALLSSSFSIHSYTCYSSTFLCPLLSQALQRKYMFLLCNGILVFLASLSGFWRSNTRIQQKFGEGHDDVHDQVNSIALQEAPPLQLLYEEEAAAAAAEFAVTTMVAAPEEESLQAQEHGGGERLCEQVGEDWIGDGSGGLEAKEEIVENKSMVAEAEGAESENEKDETASEEPASINTEELNRKIEEFIRKMKEELRLEAQQQHLIAV